MSGSSDDLPIDGIPLDEIERTKQEFDLDESRERLLKALEEGMPIVGIGKRLTEDYWLKHVIGMIEDEKTGPMVKARALTMFGQYLGILSDKRKPGGKINVKFDESV